MGRRICRGAVWVVAVLAGLCTSALAGPPFQTDDPEPVEYHHFEMYAFTLSDSTSDGTALLAPAYEVNWGAAPGLQLHLVVPLVTNIPSDGSKEYGIGDTELGAKYRFVKETKWLPQVGIFPFIELPSGNSDKGLGAGTTWYRLPLWLQKSWGPWTTYGGGGEALVPAAGSKNYPFAGWLVQREINKKLTLGGELFGHGQITPDSDSSTMFDAGGIYEFKDGFDLLFTAGHSVAGQSETYTYLALYWTWGPKDAKGSGGKLAGMLKKMRLR